MEHIKIVIFDCDGVMFDSVKANTAYYNTILGHFGRGPMTAEQFDYVHMHTVYAALRYLFDNETDRKAALSYSATMNYEEFIKYMEIEPNLKILLDWLKPVMKTAVATNRSTTIGRVLTEHNLDDRLRFSRAAVPLRASVFVRRAADVRLGHRARRRGESSDPGARSPRSRASSLASGRCGCRAC